MVQKNVEKKVKEIIAKHLDTPLNNISDESNIGSDLGADSLDRVELVMGFEEAFGIEISDESAEKIETVQDAISFIQNYDESKKENGKSKPEKQSTSSSAT